MTISRHCEINVFSQHPVRALDIILYVYNNKYTLKGTAHTII